MNNQPLLPMNNPKNEDLEQLWARSGATPESIERCVHELVLTQAFNSPDSPAVCAWDGQLTYGELDNLSTRLAGHLVTLGIQPEAIIPLCFEKSMWMVVAMMAVLKSGAAFAPLDPQHPESRHTEIINQTGAKVIISSPQSSKLRSTWQDQGCNIVMLNAASMEQLSDDGEVFVPVHPGNMVYVIFTSGSTGAPKGVVLDHRAVATSCIVHGRVLGFARSTRALQFAAHTFDVCITEVFTTLIFGGCICIPSDGERQNDLTGVISRMNVNWAYFTPSVAQLLDPQSIPSLKTLAIGGEHVKTADCKRWEGYVEVINLYGPAECAIFCTVLLHVREFYSGNIGKPMGCVCWIVDADNHDQLTPLGSVGEILVEGPILARGYLNSPEKTESAFINSPAWLSQGGAGYSGRRGVMYKTGDLAKYDSDGNIVWVGRKDGQVKIRGQRLELGEIENTLLAHKSVSQAAVILTNHGGIGAHLSGFVTLRKDNVAIEAPSDAGSESQSVGMWAQRFESETYSSIQDVSIESIGRDFVGWTSMLDGKNIDKTEMNEWLDDTIDTFLNGGDAGNVLEIGSGTGMILFNLGKGLKSYVGLDVSKTSVDFIEKTVQSIPSLKDKVHVYKGSATDIGQLRQPREFDHIIINSVVQYFPSLDYLYNVIKSLLEMKISRSVFIGDVRSHPLQREFLAQRALHIAGNGAKKDDILRMMADMEQVELELLVDPGFFTALRSRLPHLVDHVEILPKRMTATNELSCYRYAVVIHPRAEDQQEHKIRAVPQDAWVDFREYGLNRESLSQRLKHLSGSSILALSNIPYSKTVLSRCLVNALENSSSEAEEHEPWLSSVRQKAESLASLSAVELVELARQSNCRVEISWSRQYSQSGALDAIFHRVHPNDATERVLFHFPTDHESLMFHEMSNTRSGSHQKLQRELRTMLQDQLPSYMVPQSITILESMPLNSSGKTDRKILSQRAQQLKPHISEGTTSQKPSTEKERRVQKLWAQALGIDADTIGRDDSFFRLGGNSLVAMRLVGDARKCGVHFTVSDIFRYPKLSDLANSNQENTPISLSKIDPFSLLGSADRAIKIRQEVSASCGVSESRIADIYPCSPLQEGLFSLTSKSSGDYVMRLVLKLHEDVYESLFKSAWEQVVQSMPILRTRIVMHSSIGLLQAIIAEEIQWVQANNLNKYVELDKVAQMEIGRPLARYGLINNHEGDRWFVWTVHHAQFDGWTLPRILNSVNDAYRGAQIPRPKVEFPSFIKYLAEQNRETATSYWKATLSNYQEPHFPTLPASIKQPVAETTLEWQCPPLPSTPSDTTTSTLIRAAWAITVSHFTNTKDIVFGATVSGRNAPIIGIDSIPGPTIASLPLRIQVCNDQSVGEFLKTVQDQATEMIPFEQTGLQNIAKIPGAQHACSFQTLLVVQPEINLLEGQTMLGEWQGRPELQDYTTYSLMLECSIGSRDIEMKARFDRRVVEDWLVNQMLSHFSFVMQQLAAADLVLPIGKLETITPETRTELWKSSGLVPQPIDQCVHEIIRAQTYKNPNAPAIYGWDGASYKQTTYTELEDLSTKLAHQLLQFGVKTGMIVPICFEKSMWAIVAMLAVLKAGGAFTPLEPEHPRSRHEEILRQTRAKLVLVSTLSSKLHYATWADGGCTAITVSANSIDQLPKCINKPLPYTHPSSTVYVLFTSGSTGIPKGVVLQHQAVSSSCLIHGSALQFTPSVRALQFAAFTFDACITEIFTTLMFGGCICVPSENDRRDDLAGIINRLEANWAYFTPSVAQLLDPSSVPCLKMLTMGGELVKTTDVERWRYHLQLVTLYGPTETAVFSTILYLMDQEFKSGEVGQALSSVSWVVDPDDHNRLLPLGAVGEYLVEGPNLAQGYLNDHAKTSAAFIDSPSWLSEGAAGFPGRNGSKMYKTGDLVTKDPKGNLVWIRRKDNQIKIRGQRMELREIEYHVQKSLPDVEQVVVEVIHPGEGKENATLAAFLQTSTHRSASRPIKGTLEHDLSAQLVQPAGIEDKLADYLPSYMVPTIFFSLQQFPMQSSGKTNRKALREIGSSFSTKQLAEMQTSSQGGKRKPRNEVEDTLQKLWARVLNIDADNIGIDDSFFRLGGDSITAMQVSSNARLHQISLPTRTILQKKTISQLAAHLATTKTTTLGQSENSINVSFGLTPIQDLYLRLVDSNKPNLTQRFYLKLRTSVSLDSLSAAIAVLIQRHSMLRARITQSEKGLWQQYLSENVEGSFTLRRVQSREAADKRQALLDSSSLLNITTGPLLAAVLLDEDDDQSLFVTIHHLVIDLFSWRVLLEELEDLLLGKTLSHPPSTSFQTWHALQAEHATQLAESYHSVSSNPSSRPLTYWGTTSSSTITTESFILSRETTDYLLGSCNDAFRTRPNELMIAALIHSFAHTFTDRQPPVVFNETHGREPWNDDIDLSRTIGWFTSMFPVQVSDDTCSDLIDVIRQTKDIVRSFKDNGRPYFASRFANKETAHEFASLFPVELIFNYQGIFQQFERAGSLLKNQNIPEDCDSGDAMRFSLFEVSVVVDEGCAQVSVSHRCAPDRHERIQTWVQQYKETLVEVCCILHNKPQEWTLSDFPLVFNSYEELDQLRSRTLPQLSVDVEDVEDVYECSPMQDGILMSQKKDPDAYRVSFIFEVLSTNNTPIDCGRLQKAWEAVVQRHSLLRSLLVDNVPGSSAHTNVILKNPKPNVTLTQADGDVIDLEFFRVRRDDIAIQSTSLQHQLSICQLNDGRVYMCLDISHAILDAHSRGIIMHDLRKAYTGDLDPHGSSFRNVVSYLKQQSNEEAKYYWANKLEFTEPCYFPSAGRGGDERARNETVRIPGLDIRIIQEFCKTWEITPATVIRTAWALVLSRYTGSKALCFGNLNSGRDLPINDAAHIFGPLITMLISYIRFEEHLTVLEALRLVQQDYLDSTPYQTFPLSSIYKLLDLGCSSLFNTALSIQRIEKPNTTDVFDIDFRSHFDLDPTEFDITVDAAYNDNELELGITYRTMCMDRSDALRVAQCLSKAINTIVAQPNFAILDLDLTSENDNRQIWDQSSAVPQAIEQCVHELIITQTYRNQDAAAICAWDGEMTYNKLDMMSTMLANEIVALSVQLEDIIPLCFEKSMWTIVAMLAVLKAGAAFTPLDPDHPHNRQKEILRQTKAKVVLASVDAVQNHSFLWEKLGCTVITVGSASLDQLSKQSANAPPTPPELPRIKPSHTAYILFTSGSTGTPKGVVLEHQAVSTSCLAHGNLLGFSAQTRALQFATYTFDACIAEIFTTLIFGGCICIPSEHSRRNNLSAAITDLNANWAFLTPSVARILEPSTVHCLKRLTLGGEQVNPVDWERWQDTAQLSNGYGPTETCVFSVAFIEQNLEPGLIGKPVGCVCWVVDPNNHNILAPLGSVGELLIEGPALARGYLNDLDKTAAVFIDNPTWLVEGTKYHPGRVGKKLYKTGDLVRYKNGSIFYIGRKDGQVKIRGQRIELGEVEHHVECCMPEVQKVVVEAINSPGQEKHNTTLAGFLQIESRVHSATPKGNSPLQVVYPRKVEEELIARLPSYMVPRVFFELEKFPTTSSGKTDRRALKRLGELFSAQQLAEVRTISQGHKRKPTTSAEQTLQRLWAHVLEIELDSIGLDDSFFWLGGDSISVMRLVSEARKEGIHLTVSDIFKHPKLADLTSLNREQNNIVCPVAQIKPFILLGSGFDVQKIRREAATSCNVAEAMVENVYPCSPLQEGLLSLTSKSSGDYVMQFVLKLGKAVNEKRFRDAWEQVVQSIPILRTRMILQDTLLQAVLTEEVQWTHAEDLDTYLAKDKADIMELGKPLARYALIKRRDGTKRWFVWTIHHALYDGWSLPRILTTLSDAYNGREIKTQTDYKMFIKYLNEQDHDAAVKYWQSSLTDCQAVTFPALPMGHQPNANTIIKHQCPLLPQIRSETTTSTLIRAAWGMTVSRFTNTDDVVFGTTVTGRNAPVVGIDSVIGPTIATVPLRIQLTDQTVSAFLNTVQKQSTDMIPFEQTGLQRITKINPDTQHACAFQTLLVIQPNDDHLALDGRDLGEWQDHEELGGFATYGLMLQCVIGKKGIQIEARFDALMIDDWLMRQALDQFSFIMQELATAGPEKKIGDVETVTPTSLSIIWEYNSSLPAPVDKNIHNLIHIQATRNLSAPALCAWDGNMTYGELDEQSTRLAAYLVDTVGIRPETFVPFCFEKSMWTVVAMLAVLKAGAAFVPLDPEHPQSRLDAILTQLNATVILVSALHSPRWSNQDCCVVTIDKSSIHQLPMVTDTEEPLPSVHAENAAYAIFTSGSTGTPKGVVLEHRAMSSSCLSHGKILGFSPDTRALQFAAYTFDVCILEIMTTLLFGGCVCVPSDEDRKDNLPTAIDTLGANWALLTPSVARLFDPSTISLEGLALGGEQVTLSDWQRWSGKVQLWNGYGPTEACIICCLFSADRNFESGLIGQAVGSVAWIVDPKNHNRLAPLGSVGELVMEGPILARGYLGDAEKTAQAFIENPPWLSHGGSGYAGRSGRVYKTGDLVRYTADGRLVCVGRKDSQVKIRGQRIELGEIEHHIQKCFPETHQVAVEVIFPTGGNGNDNATLAAFVQTTCQTETAPKLLPLEVQKDLAERLPSYMVPSVLFELTQFPVTTSGKTDKRCLRNLGASFSMQQLAEMRTLSQGQNHKRMPTSDLEYTLQELWSRVLNIDAASVGVDDSFFWLGGDSITAMQLCSSARLLQIHFSTRIVFQEKTISRLATYIMSSTACLSSAPVVEEDQTNVPFELSPIQELYLRPGSETYNLDQCFFLDVRSQIYLGSLISSFEILVQRHPMLRARFNKSDDGKWQQYISDNVNASFIVRQVSVPSQDSPETREAIIQSRTSLDIENGPMMAAVLLEGENHQSFFITVHHLVIDLFSWRVILEELENLIMGNKLSHPPSLPFQTWRKLQAEQAVRGSLSNQSLHSDYPSNDHSEQNLLSYWDVDPTSPAQVTTETFTLSQPTTTALLGTSNTTYQTRPMELMIASLLHSFSLTFPDRNLNLPPIFNETHGREPWNETIDLSRTIGWFTSMHPVQVSNATNLPDTIRQTRDSVRSFAYNGRSYFASQFVNEDAKTRFFDMFPVEITFNYQGQFQQFERRESLFSVVDAPAGCDGVSVKEVMRFSVFTVAVGVEGGRAVVRFFHGCGGEVGGRVKEWVERYREVLEEVAGLKA